jgi:hypothetical protein
MTACISFLELRLLDSSPARAALSASQPFPSLLRSPFFISTRPSLDVISSLRLSMTRFRPLRARFAQSVL